MSEPFSIFDILREKKILKEAEEDNQEETTDDSSADSPAEGEDSKDDFNIDASLDNNEDNSGEEDESIESEDNSSNDNSSSDSSNEEESDGNSEINQDNTDIFASLTAEEQQIKIKELKLLYKNLYSSCDDILDRINDIETDEYNIYIFKRIASAMYNLKKYIADYLVHVFPKKSYVENDIAFNRFLMILKSITNILDKFKQKVDKDEEK